MDKGNISNLSNIYGSKPYSISLEAARKIAKEGKIKRRSRKNPEGAKFERKIKAYSVIGLLSAIGISSSVLFGSKLISNHFENNRLIETASQSSLNEYNLLDETGKGLNDFYKLILETDNLLHSKELDEAEKIKLKENLLTIESNLDNVIKYTDTQIENLFKTNTGISTSVKTMPGQGNSQDGPFNKVSIKVGNNDYLFCSNDYAVLGMLKGENNIKSPTLKALIDNQFKLSSINANQKAYAPLENTFKLVKDNLIKCNSLKDLSIHIDEKGNIIEDSKDLER